MNADREIVTVHRPVGNWTKGEIGFGEQSGCAAAAAHARVRYGPPGPFETLILPSLRFRLNESPFHPCLPIHSWQGSTFRRGQLMPLRFLKRLLANTLHHFSFALLALATIHPCQPTWPLPTVYRRLCLLPRCAVCHRFDGRPNGPID